MVRALASHQCVPGSIPRPGVICGLSLLLVLALAPRVFLRVLRFSSLLKNQHFYSIGNSRATDLSVEDCYVLPSLNKVNLFILFYLFLVPIIVQGFHNGPGTRQIDWLSELPTTKVDDFCIEHGFHNICDIENPQGVKKGYMYNLTTLKDQLKHGECY